MLAVAQKFLVSIKGYSFTVLFDEDENAYLERPSETVYNMNGSWYSKAEALSQLGYKELPEKTRTKSRPRYDLRSETCQRIVLEAATAADAKEAFLDLFGIIKVDSDRLLSRPAKAGAELGPVKHKSMAKAEPDPEEDEEPTPKRHQARKRKRSARTKFPAKKDGKAKGKAEPGKPGKPGKPKKDAKAKGDELLRTGHPAKG